MPSDAASQRILAVDDNPYILRIISRVLESAGFQVVTAMSGHEALRLIERSGLPHLALVDLNMPGMDGWTFSRTVREVSDMPIIILTALGNEQRVLESVEGFADDCIFKPFHPKDLIARIQRALLRVDDPTC